MTRLLTAAAYCPLPALPGLQLASFAIVVNQLRNIYDAFFLSECDRCRGTGLVTCPHVSRERQGRAGACAGSAGLHATCAMCCLQRS